jgi:hypothetical protein
MIFFLKKTKFIVPMIAIVLLFSGVSKVDARAMRTGDPCYKTIDNHDGTATTYTGSWVSYDGGTGSDGDCNFACGSAVKGGTVGVANSLSIPSLLQIVPKVSTTIFDEIKLLFNKNHFYEQPRK